MKTIYLKYVLQHFLFRFFDRVDGIRVNSKNLEFAQRAIYHNVMIKNENILPEISEL